MPHLLLKKRQNFKMSSAANYRLSVEQTMGAATMNIITAKGPVKQFFSA